MLGFGFHFHSNKGFGSGSGTGSLRSGSSPCAHCSRSAFSADVAGTTVRRRKAINDHRSTYSRRTDRFNPDSIESNSVDFRRQPSPNFDHFDAVFPPPSPTLLPRRYPTTIDRLLVLWCRTLRRSWKITCPPRPERRRDRVIAARLRSSNMNNN